jgi:hypothetical protein
MISKMLGSSTTDDPVQGPGAPGRDIEREGVAARCPIALDFGPPREINPILARTIFADGEE